MMELFGTWPQRRLLQEYVAEETFAGPTVLFCIPTRSVPLHLGKQSVTVIEGATHYDILTNAEFLAACTAYVQSVFDELEENGNGD